VSEYVFESDFRSRRSTTLFTTFPGQLSSVFAEQRLAQVRYLVNSRGPITNDVQTPSQGFLTECQTYGTPVRRYLGRSKRRNVRVFFFNFPTCRPKSSVRSETASDVHLDVDAVFTVSVVDDRELGGHDKTLCLKTYAYMCFVRNGDITRTGECGTFTPAVTPTTLPSLYRVIIQ